MAYLASKGYRGKPGNGPEVVYPCFMDCGEAADSRKRKLYVNISDGFYNCKVCGAQGGTFLLQRFFGDDPQKPPPPDDSFARRKILNWAADTGVSMLNNNDDVLLYLINERGLDPDTITSRRLGFIATGWSLTRSLPEQFTKEQLSHTGLVHKEGNRAGQDFFYNHILIPYLSHNDVIQIRGRIWGDSKGGKYMTGPGDPARLFNADDLEGAEEVIITEGEFDAMVLKQHLLASSEPRLRAMAVVGLAGTNALPDDFESYFTNVKRVFIGFDSDEPGKRAAEKLKEKLGKRTRVIDLPIEDGRKCDWTEFLLPIPDSANSLWHAEHPYAGHSWSDVLQLLGAASGKRIFSVAEAGMAYRQYRAVSEGWQTGYSGLDSTIAPGILPGQVMVVLAKTGTGKTVFLCNLAYNMRRQKILFISLEMTREEVYDRLRKIYLFHNPAATDEVLEHAMGNIWISDENRLGEKDLNTLVDEFEVEAGFRPDIVFVDYLGYYARGARGNSPYEKTTNAVMQLKAEAKAGRFAVITPSQVNRVAKEGKPIDLDDARDSGAIEETADFLLALYRPDDALVADAAGQQQSGKVKCSVLKSRHGGKDRVFTFVMDMLTLAMVDDGTPGAKRATEHNYEAWRGKSWHDLRKEETAPRQLAFAGKGNP